MYIEELPGGARTITGVPTSNTAFLGRTSRGPTETPVVVNSVADYDREFGAIRVDYPLGYAVRGFFDNGGRVAVVQRAYSPTGGGTGVAGAAVGGIPITAAGPGAWGNNLQVSTDLDGITAEVADRYNVPLDQLFNLTVREGDQNVERILNVVAGIETPGNRRVDRILEHFSQRIRTTGDDLSDTRPDPTEFVPLDGGDDGGPLEQADYERALASLEQADPIRYFFSLMCIPPDARDAEGGETSRDVYGAALELCERRRAFLIVDPPTAWTTVAHVSLEDVVSGPAARNAAVYFPRVIQTDPLLEGQLDSFAPSGIVAGIMARTDMNRGVWKAPAGIDASLNGVQDLTVRITNDENSQLNRLGVNCLRSFAVYNQVVWGTRTLLGADVLADEWKYVPVRRLVLQPHLP